MKQNKIAMWALGFGLVLASGCAVRPKIMTSHQYLGEARSAKTLIQASEKVGDDAQLFNYFLRVCNLEGAGEKQCKDSLILENVTPGSLY